MLDLKIIKIEKACYILEDENKNTQSLLLEFFGMDKPKKGDVLLLPEKLLDRRSVNFVQPYSFEPLKSEEDLKNGKYTKDDVAGIIKNGKEFLLKRIYG